MDEKTLLEEVKTSLNITGNFQDDTLKNYIFEVLEYLADAGVSENVLKSEAIIGVVARGVSDLWTNGANLSPYFMQRVTQLCFKEG